MKLTVIAVPELTWDFDRGSFVRLPPTDGSYGHQVAVDPFPCHAHDIELVKRELEYVAGVYPLGHDVQLSLLSHEALKRTNAECDIDWIDWQAPFPKPWAANIRLWGKRIPPHPAMTRHLVAHEYGHAVAREIADRKGFEHCDLLYEEYRGLRSLSETCRVNNNSNSWHLSIAEIFADDFRHLVAHRELEYWPHPTVVQPADVAGLDGWWSQQILAVKGA